MYCSHSSSLVSAFESQKSSSAMDGTIRPDFSSDASSTAQANQSLMSVP